MERKNPDNHLKGLSVIIALLISITSWIYVVYNYDPMTRVTYQNVPITFIGEDTLADKGYALSDVSTESIYVTLNQKRIESTKIDADDITVVADVSNAVEGKNGISLGIVGPEGTQLVDSEVRTISVTVEQAERVEVGIDVMYLDDSVINVEPIATNLTSTKATVIGASSTVNTVEKAVAYIGYSDTAEGAGVYTRNLVAVDSHGNEVQHMVIYPGSVNFSAEHGVVKTVDLVLKTVDNSDDNYERTVDAPDTIAVKGSSSAVESLSRLETIETDISYIYEDSDIELQFDLPEGVYLANTSRGVKMHVKVTEKVEPEEKEEDNG